MAGIRLRRRARCDSPVDDGIPGDNAAMAGYRPGDGAEHRRLDEPARHPAWGLI
jgi:hypothetical protein